MDKLEKFINAVKLIGLGIVLYWALFNVTVSFEAGLFLVILSGILLFALFGKIWGGRLEKVVEEDQDQRRLEYLSEAIRFRYRNSTGLSGHLVEIEWEDVSNLNDETTDPILIKTGRQRNIHFGEDGLTSYQTEYVLSRSKKAYGYMFFDTYRKARGPMDYETILETPGLYTLDITLANEKEFNRGQEPARFKVSLEDYEGPAAGWGAQD